MSSSSDSDGESLSVDGNPNSRIHKAASDYLSDKPTHIVKAKSKRTMDIRSKLQKLNSSKSRQSSRIDSNKRLEDICKDVQSDLSCISGKFDMFVECLLELSEKVEDLEKRVVIIERNSSSSLPHASLDQIENLEKRVVFIEQKTNSPTYSAVASAERRTTDDRVDGDRLDRVEFLTSEDERKRRLLEVTITHPDIDKDANQLDEHIKKFLTSKIKMNEREIDANLKAFKSARDKTTKVIFSHIRFKKFLFAARRKMFLDDRDACQNLYINENLTPYNYDILKTLKREKKRREENNEPNLDAVYTFEGRVFVKKVRTDSKTPGTVISSRKSLENFLNQMSSS